MRDSKKQTSLKKPWSRSVSSVLNDLGVTRQGLALAEVTRRRQLHGRNRIRVPSRLTALTLFLNQFKSPLIVALIIAGLISVVISMTIEPRWVEAVVILLVVVVNTGLGFWQEFKAERSLELLNTYTKITATVVRSGAEHVIEASELVPGDVIKIDQGDRMPADARLIEANTLNVDEATLTGESLSVSKQSDPVEEDTSLGDRISMVYNGTNVVQGYGVAVVTETGPRTELGAIAEMVADKQQQETPLQRSIRSFAKKAGIVLVGMGALLFVLGYFVAGKELTDIFFIAVAAIVSAVPEGLPVAVTVVLSIGVARLAKRKGVVRKLLAAETLGSTTHVLTDKTGTLTEANMVLQDVRPADGVSVEEVLQRAITNTNVTVEGANAEPEDWQMRGEPLEQALIIRSARDAIYVKEERNAFREFNRLPFSAERKYSASLGTTQDNRYQIDLLGAPEVLIDHTDLSDDEKRAMKKQIQERAREGARLIMCVSATVDQSPYDDPEQAIEHTTFSLYGILSFRDPIRASVKEAVHKITKGGVQTVVVTGDHIGTASYVAEQLGIIESDTQACEGTELAQMNDEQLAAAIDHIRVFARVSPSQKVRLVEAFQKRGDIVAVTGDGVNDAPALKTAGIGVAMGAGTDVAKSASDLIILDNNFETIVAAIEEGRTIVGNLRKVIIFLLSDSFDELVLIGGAILTGLALPLTAIQILFVKMFTDTLPALSFPFDRGEGAMASGPHRLRRKLFDFETKVFTIGRGLFSAVFLFAIYWILLQYTQIDAGVVRTFIFASFSTYILFLVFPLRSIERNIWEFNPFSNWYINGGVALGFLMTVLAIYLPLFRNILGTSYLPLWYGVAVLGVGLINVVSMELLKLWFKKRRRNHKEG